MTNEFEQHDQPATRLMRAPDVIKESKAWVVDRWLHLVQATPELIAVTMSDTERSDHVPDLLDEAVASACEHPINLYERQKAAERHGTLRFHQGYSIPMLILEARLLQNVLAECIQENLGSIDLSRIVPDVAAISGTLLTELQESAAAYMRQYDWHPSRRR